MQKINIAFSVSSKGTKNVYKMKTALQVDIIFDEVLALVKQLSATEKIELTKELEKEGIKSKLSELLKTFQTDELSLETIDEEVEAVRLFLTRMFGLVFLLASVCNQLKSTLQIKKL